MNAEQQKPSKSEKLKKLLAKPELAPYVQLALKEFEEEQGIKEVALVKKKLAYIEEKTQQHLKEYRSARARMRYEKNKISKLMEIKEDFLADGDVERLDKKLEIKHL